MSDEDVEQRLEQSPDPAERRFRCIISVDAMCNMGQLTFGIHTRYSMSILISLYRFI